MPSSKPAALRGGDRAVEVVRRAALRAVAGAALVALGAVVVAAVLVVDARLAGEVVPDPAAAGAVRRR